jgi:hypothetical protein
MLLGFWGERSHCARWCWLGGSAGADSSTGGAGEPRKVERYNSMVGNVDMKDKQLVKSRKQKSKKLYIFLLILVLFCGVGAGLSLVGYQTYDGNYHQDLSLAQVGMQHLQTAEMLLKMLPKNPFDAQNVSQAQHEFAASLAAFVQVDNDLKSLPGISTSIPVYGARLSAALHVLPIAIELSQAGIVGCNALTLIISRLHNPVSAQAQRVTMADFTVIEKDFQQIKAALTLMVDKVNHLQPADLQLDPRLGRYLASFQKDLPQLQLWLGAIERLLPVATTLLGIGTPTNYLIEILDSTELRPGGGFIGNYGIATFSGGRLTAVHITDTYLLDKANNATGHVIPYPSTYAWFDLATSWSLRDSNLDADFPTAARYAELNYAREGGNIPVQGVVAITPMLIERALEITGPISVPEYRETVTEQNLVDRIHYYQVGPGNKSGGDTPSPDGLSSVRKRFTALLAEHFLVRVRQGPSSAFPKLLQLMISSLRSKDVQIYLNPSSVESLLQSYHLGSSIQSSRGDGLFVVDANISPSKANSLITNTLNDEVALDAQGNAIHHTTIRYAWVSQGPVYGSDLYRDYVRVYVPPGSVLQAQDGWEPRGMSKAFGREVWAGFFTLSYGQADTITLIWKVPGVATKDAKGWHYQYVLQRQAGARWMLHLHISLPSCGVMIRKSGGLASTSSQGVTLAQSLIADVNAGIDYNCG